MRPWRTFRQKLQLSITMLLCLVVAAVAWAAHRQVRTVLEGATRTRLEATAREVAGILGTTTRRVAREARDSAARRPALLAALASGSDARRVEAAEALERFRTPVSVVPYAALLDRAGVAVAASGRPLIAPDAGAPARRPMAGALVATDSGALFRMMVPVTGAAQDTVGWLELHRRITAEPGARQLRNVIGAEAVLRVGNADGGFWTNLLRPASAPPTLERSGSAEARDTTDGTRFFATRLAVEGTPWVVALHTARERALAPARDFLVQIALISLGFIALGGILAWALSTQTTAPLAEITRAAEDVARGDYDRRVSITGSHELGSLAASFNSMAEQVGSSAEELSRHARELEAANAELRGSEERYRRLVEVAHEGICTVDARGVVTYANARLAEMVGHPVEALVGRSWFELLEPEEAFAARTDFARRRLGIAESQQVTLRRADGAPVHALQSMSSLFAEGEFAGALYMLSDVTDRHALEAQLIQAQKMEAVGQLAGGIAHDFNNLLTVVTSYSAILMGELPEGSQRHADVQEIAHAADRAAALTRQLLAFSRQQVLQPRVLDLNAVVGDIQRMLVRVLREDIRLETELAPSLGSVFADPGQMEQVLVNLAVNARDAMPDGGTLGIATADVVLDDEFVRLHPGLAAGPHVLLEVRDTGVGMDAATRARAFEPFFTTKAPGQGTGLGLSTVYGIVRQSGGDVVVDSTPGAGTSVRIYLPRADATATAAPRRRSTEADVQGSETVLLVEDEDAVRSVARRILERAGYTVLEAGSGAEALRLFDARGGEVDVLLTDMVMPELGGRELASRLRARRPSLPTVFMSGYTEDTVLRGGGADPGALFVQKPFTTRALTERLREAIGMRKVS